MHDLTRYDTIFAMKGNDEKTAQGQPNGRRGGTEAEEMRSARRQARHSVRVALRRAQDYVADGELTTPRDWEGILVVLMRADKYLSTMEDYYG